MRSDTLVVAVGEAGQAIAEAVKHHMGADVLLINTDGSNRLCNEERCISLGTEGGDGRFYSPRHARKAALQIEQDILQALGPYRRVVIAVGLGGATGSGAAPVVADAAARLGKPLLGAVTMPFGFEGEKVTIAQTALDSLRRTCDQVIVHDHQRALSSLGAYSLKEAFHLVAEQLGKSVAEKLPPSPCL